MKAFLDFGELGPVYANLSGDFVIEGKHPRAVNPPRALTTPRSRSTVGIWTPQWPLLALRCEQRRVLLYEPACHHKYKTAALISSQQG